MTPQSSPWTKASQGDTSPPLSLCLLPKDIQWERSLLQECQKQKEASRNIRSAGPLYSSSRPACQGNLLSAAPVLAGHMGLPPSGSVTSLLGYIPAWGDPGMTEALGGSQGLIGREVVRFSSSELEKVLPRVILGTGNQSLGRGPRGERLLKGRQCLLQAVGLGTPHTEPLPKPKRQNGTFLPDEKI